MSGKVCFPAVVLLRHRQLAVGTERGRASDRVLIDHVGDAVGAEGVGRLLNAEVGELGAVAGAAEVSDWVAGADLVAYLRDDGALLDVAGA